MANWCINSVSFTGEESNVNKVMELFKAMEANEAIKHEGQKPEFMDEVKEGYFFNIYINDDCSVSYETKWSPNIADVVEIAKAYDVNFIMDYEETGNCIFGKAIYTAGNDEAQEYDLLNEDFMQYDYDYENDCYMFRGESYDDSYEDILFALFEERHGFAY